MTSRKRPRTESVVDQRDNADNVFKRAGEILFAVSDIKEFAQGAAGQTKFSNAVYLNGLSWKVEVEHRDDSAYMHLHCDGDEKDITWACRAAVQFSVVPPSSGTGEFVTKQVGDLTDFAVFCVGSESYGFGMLATFTELMSVADSVTFKAELIVGRRKEMIGIRTEDALLVNEEEVYVNKYVLAGYSQFFRPLFFGGNVDEVPKVQIDGPDAVEKFERLVVATHDPLRVELNDDCVEDILLLANRFQFDSVVNRCFEFLLDKSNKSATFKFRLADQCGNVTMKKKILNAMTKDDFPWQDHFKNRSEEDKLGVAAKIELEERHNALVTSDMSEFLASSRFS